MAKREFKRLYSLVRGLVRDNAELLAPIYIDEYNARYNTALKAVDFNLYF